MSDKFTYSRYEELYPKTVILRREGPFYNARNESARVIHANFDFKGWKSSNGIPTIGFRIDKLHRVRARLEKLYISYIIIEQDDVVVEKNFGNINAFIRYETTSVDDLPTQKVKKKDDNKHIYEMDETTKKLMSISVKYLERMLDGKHPVYKTPISEDSILKDDNVRQCFSFIIDMFNKIETQSQIVEEHRRKKNQTKLEYHYKEDYKRTIDRMVTCGELRMGELQLIVNENIADLICEKAKITSYKVSNWLKDNGYLVQVEEDGNRHREASARGVSVGIKNVTIDNGEAGSYVTYRFTAQGQRFVCENLVSILKYKKQK